MAELLNKVFAEKPQVFRSLSVINWMFGMDLFGHSTPPMRLRVVFMILLSFLVTVQQGITCARSTTLELRVETVSSTIVVVCCFVKILLVWINQEKFHKIYIILRELVSFQLVEPHNEDILLSAERKVRFVVIFFSNIDGLTLVTLLLSTAMYNLKHPNSTKLPLQSWFPFDAYSTPARFKIGFAWIGISLAFLAVVVAGMRSTFCGTNFYIAAQMKILQGRFKGLSAVVRDRLKFHESIVKLVEHHSKIMNLVSLMNEVFAYSQLFEVILSSIQCCSLTFLCSKIGLLDPKIGFLLPFLSGSISSLFVICFVGQLIKDESLKINEAAYEVPWYELDPISRREFLFVLRQSSRPLKVHVKQTFSMEMSVFLTSMQSAYSLMAILNSMET